MMPLLVLLVWEVARVIREQRQLQKERQELIEAEEALAINRRPYFTVQQPDGNCSVCRVEEHYYGKTLKDQRKKSKKFSKTLKSCFCIGGSDRRCDTAQAEHWQLAGPRLVQ